MGAGPDSIVVNPTGCLEVTSTPFPRSSWQVPWIHSLFENGASVASGIEAGLKALGKKKDTKIIVIAGDGATMDIGFGAISGAFERGHDFTYVCMDNEAYMNTGVPAQQWNALWCKHNDHSSRKILFWKPFSQKEYACNYSSSWLSICGHDLHRFPKRHDS